MDRDTKFKEQQPDKMEIINRLEKEKKVMQKKEKEEEKRKNTKPKTAAKPKRMNNIGLENMKMILMTMMRWMRI